MNPNFLNNFTPEQIEQTRKMMNPEMMKTASNMFQNMSDDQIQGYLNMMGMSGMSPQQFRQMSSSLGNLTPEQIETMKNQKIPSYYPNPYQQPPQPTTPKDPDRRGTFIENLNSIKNDGNAYFRQKYYKSACDKYYEILNEIKTAPDMTRNAFQKEIEDMERIVRLNIAACKLQQGEYDCVISECLIVLEKHKCFKAYYRMGVAWYSKGKYEKALSYLEEGEKIANSNEKGDVEKYLKLCRDEIKKKEEEEEKKKQKEKEEKERKENEERERKEKENKEKEERERKEKEKEKEKETTITTEDKVNSKEEEKKEETIHTDTKPKETKDKLSSMENLINKEKEQLSQNNNNNNNTNDNDDIKVESASPSTNTTPSSNIPPQQQQQPPFTGMPPNMPHNPNDYLSKLNDIPDSQLNSMMDMIKSMDNASLKSMLQSQGMNLDDQQISMLKSTMNMDTFNMLRSPQFQQNFGSYMNTPPTQSSSSPTQSTTPNTNTSSQQHPPNPSTQSGATPSGFPNLQNFDLKSMLQFLKSNPDMLKAISPQFEKMFGNNKIDPQTMISMLEKTLWITEVPGRIKRFLFSWRGVCLLMIIIAIILAWKY